MNITKYINRFIRYQNIFFLANRYSHNLAKANFSSNFILGIETSCDDTGCAIINEKGALLSEVLHSQSLVHLRNGGIIPDIAQDLHRTHIEPAVHQTLKAVSLTMDNISAIAVTLKPGLPLSLAVGMKYAKYLARHHNKPIIPIHHMEAHALAARMHHQIDFPFLTLLISGGHCLLSLVEDVNSYKLLGESIDNAPGEMFDKIARSMKLKNLPEYSKLSGGEAIERAAAKSTNPHIFKLPLPLAEYRDCNFSFSGLKSSVLFNLSKKEKEHKVMADKLIPEVNDLCAATLMAATRHLVHRTQRAMEFCELNNLVPDNNKQLVVSGGVACNNYIFNALSMLCSELDYKIYRPIPKLCTDNGVMIAWNGLEKWRRNMDIISNLDSLDIESVSPLGKSVISEVSKANIPVKALKIKINIM